MINLPIGVDIKTLIIDLREISWEASEIFLYYSRILKDPNSKSNIIKNDSINDPVTQADLSVNELIIKKINEKYNDTNWEILSEENEKFDPLNQNKNSDWLWVLDPLDGTRDFIQGTSNYAMHLALNYKQKPCIGIVLIPEKDELWITDGEKVWCEKRDGSKIRPNLSKNGTLQEMILVTSKNHRNETLTKVIKNIDFKEVKSMGSIGCKIASILRGESDIYLSLSLPGKSAPKDWDLAAPEVILKMSGGAVTDLYNKELIYGKENFEQGGIIVASNNINNHERICNEIREIIEKSKIFTNLS